MDTRRQGIALFTALCVLIGTIVVIQLWLLAAAIDALLSGRETVLVPSVIASAALFAVNLGLLWHVRTFDRRVRRGTANGSG